MMMPNIPDEQRRIPRKIRIKEFKKKGILLTEVYQSDENGNHSIPEFHEKNLLF